MSWPRGRNADGGLDEVPLPDGVPGALWLCGKRVVGPDPEAALARAGAQTIVSFNEPNDLRDYPDYLQWLRDNDGGRALWFPVPDLHAPDVAIGQEWVATMIARLHRPEGLILHCAGGIGRAPTMAAAVLVNLGSTVEAALAHIAACRPMAGPEAGGQRSFLDALGT